MVIIQGVGADEGVNHPLYLGQTEGVPERGVLRPGLFERRSHGHVAAEGWHLLAAGLTQILGDHVIELQVTGGDELRHLLRIQ